VEREGKEISVTEEEINTSIAAANSVFELQLFPADVPTPLTDPWICSGA